MRYQTTNKRKLNIEESFEGLILREDSFKVDHIFECGQCFNFRKNHDGSYTAVFLDKIINLLEGDGYTLVRNVSLDDFYEIFYDYFDLGTDYESIKNELSKSEILKKASDYGYGIRILNQELFETTISFIISANNQIPRIKKSCKDNFRKIWKFPWRVYGGKVLFFPKTRSSCKGGPP